jgi:hypothetical protein
MFFSVTVEAASADTGACSSMLKHPNTGSSWVPNRTRHPSLFGGDAEYATNSYEVNSGIGLAGATHHALTGLGRISLKAPVVEFITLTPTRFPFRQTVKKSLSRKYIVAVVAGVSTPQPLKTMIEEAQLLAARARG